MKNLWAGLCLLFCSLYGTFAAEANLPPEGVRVGHDTFDNGSLCTFYKSSKQDDSYEIGNDGDALKITLHEKGEGKRLLYRGGQALPKVPPGMKAKLRLKARVKSMIDSDLEWSLWPLYSSCAGTLAFPSPSMKLPVTTEWTEVAQEWPVVDIRAITTHLFITTKHAGAVYLDDITCEVLPCPCHVLTTGTEGNIVNAESGAVTVMPYQPEKITDGLVELFDLAGEKLAAVKMTAGTREYQLALPHRGFYRISAHAEYDDGTVLDENSSAVVAGAVLPEEIWSTSRFGICSVSAGQQLTADAGGRWDWKFMNVGQAALDEQGGVKTFSAWKRPKDQKMEAILAMSGAWPKWLKPAHGETANLRIYEPADWNLYRELIKAMARGTDLPEWTCVYNEPECTWGDSWEAYVKWMTITREAIQEVKPQVKVTGPGHCNINMELFRTLGSLGLFDHLDGVTVHPYVGGTPPEGDFIKRIYELQDYLEEIGKKDLPMFFTEFGWTTGKGGWQPPVDDMTQACYTARSLALAATSRVKGMAYFALYYHTSSESEIRFSVLEPEKVPRMSFASYTSACRNLGPYSVPGKWLALSPTTHMALFHQPGRNNDRMTCMAWCTEGEEKMAMPFVVEDMAAMDNAPLTAPPNGNVVLTRQPKYLWTSDALLFDCQKAPVKRTFAGGHVVIAGERLVVPAPLTAERGRIWIPEVAQVGKYTVLGLEKGKWTAHEILVDEALTITGSRLAWEPSQGLQLVVTVVSSLNEPLEVVVQVRQNGRKATSQPVLLAAGETREITVNVQAAERLSSPWADVEAVPVKMGYCAASKIHKANLGVLECVPLEEGKNDWSQVPRVSSADFKALHAKQPLPASGDCQAQLQMAYRQEELLLRVAVRDNDHVFNVQPPDMWRQDSLQLGFDADGGKPYQPNMQFGWNGHRIFEYGVAAKESGEVCNWRWLAYHPVIKAPAAEPLIKTEFERRGFESIYVIHIPYAALGMAKAPRAGDTFSFALLINDADRIPYPAGNGRGFKAGERHGLSLFGGIVGEKDFREYGLVFFR